MDSVTSRHQATKKPHICIVTPALGKANNGNAHTAERWKRFLLPVADVSLALEWSGEPCDALIALHARRSAASVAAFRAAHPRAGLAVVLTGTDLYRDVVEGDAQSLHSLECADELVVLQARGAAGLRPAWAAKTRVIVQSAPRVRSSGVKNGANENKIKLIAIGHLREEKDPITLLQAIAALPADSHIQVEHIGRALDESLAEAARATMQEYPRYRWLGGLTHAATRRHLANADALVHMSRMEGGANVVIEAIRSGVPVLASRIDGNLGLLGDDYAGTFATGNAADLARLMLRFENDADFRALLRQQCAVREPLFAPAAERAGVRGLLQDLLHRNTRPVTGH
jgi:putative glycosyltransferase (TIGR04348 family)